MNTSPVTIIADGCVGYKSIVTKLFIHSNASIFQLKKETGRLIQQTLNTNNMQCSMKDTHHHPYL